MWYIPLELGAQNIEAFCGFFWTSLVAQMVKNLPTMQETWVQSWEKAMAPHSSPPAWEIPWAEEPGRLQSIGSRRVRHD